MSAVLIDSYTLNTPIPGATLTLTVPITFEREPVQIACAMRPKAEFSQFTKFPKVLLEVDKELHGFIDNAVTYTLPLRGGVHTLRLLVKGYDNAHVFGEEWVLEMFIVKSLISGTVVMMLDKTEFKLVRPEGMGGKS